MSCRCVHLHCEESLLGLWTERLLGCEEAIFDSGSKEKTLGIGIKLWKVDEAGWEKVHFSDDSTLCILGNHGKTYVRKFSHEKYKPECTNLR